MPRRKRIDLECQAHIYLKREVYDFVVARAEAEIRSVNGQLSFYVVKGIEAERVEAERIAALTAGKGEP